MTRSPFFWILRRGLVYVLLSSLAMSGTASAQTHPDGPVTLVVPYPPGGSVDVTARLMARELAVALKVPVLVDNRSGAAAVIGTQSVARSKPDGRTILVATAGMSIQPSVFKDLPYDVVKDFAPVTQLVVSPSLLTVNPAVPGNNLGEVVAHLKRNPGQPYSSQGLGSHAHLLMELLRADAGIDLLHVPYRGSAPATSAVLSGETLLQFDIMTSALQHIAAGKLKPLAVTTPARQKQLPNVPTLAEVGFPSAALSSWTGLFVPAGTSPQVVAMLAQATKNVLMDKSVAARLEELGYVVVGSSPSEFASFFKRDIDNFARAAALAKIDRATPN